MLNSVHERDQRLKELSLEEAPTPCGNTGGHARDARANGDELIQQLFYS